MNYLKALGFSREPFSNTPDPDFFFPSKQHYGCLQKIEVAIRLRRGLSIITGEVGSGKTTICRQLIRRLVRDEDVESHLIMDPGFASPAEFLGKVSEMLLGRPPRPETKDWETKEAIKNHLFRKGVEEQKVVILIIDEGQKIPDFCLEILREFLNYETNDYKLLQIVIFGQLELEKTVRRLANFADRINLYHRLRPLNFRDARSMINYRLDQASGSPDPPDLFTWPALWAIHQASGGYPRKIINLCHLCTLAVIIGDRSRVDWFLVRNCVKSTASFTGGRWGRPVAIGLAGVVLIVLLTVFGPSALMAWKSGEPLIPGREPVRPVVLTASHEPDPPVKTEIEPPSPAEAEPVATAPEPVPVPEPAPAPASLGVLDDALANPWSQPASPDPAVRTAALETAPEDTGQKVAPWADEAADTSVDAPVEAEPPEALGRLVVLKGENWTRLIRTVYGTTRSDVMTVMEKANPQISDHSVLQPGDEILFPARKFPVEAEMGKAYWVEIHNLASLDEAIGIIRDQSREAGLRMVPYWTPQKGLRFSIVAGNGFTDEKDAAREAEKTNARVVHGWGSGAVFFADPSLRESGR